MLRRFLFVNFQLCFCQLIFVFQVLYIIVVNAFNTVILSMRMHGVQLSFNGYYPCEGRS